MRKKQISGLRKVSCSEPAYGGAYGSTTSEETLKDGVVGGPACKGEKLIVSF